MLVETYRDNNACKMSKTPRRQEAIIRRIEDIRNTEKYVATKNNKMPAYMKKWSQQSQPQTQTTTA